MSDVIAAVATGAVRSAIGILRMSGDGCIGTVDRVFKAKNGRPMADAPSGKMVYGELRGEDGALLDLCMCVVFRSPHSATGEDTAELHCHGSPVALSSGLRALFRAGARQAGPGEFTKRAFLNGKLDLTEAEAVADLIDAETEAAVRNASGQLAGAVMRKCGLVYDALIDIVSHFQAEIDFPDEDVEPFELARYGDVLLRSLSSLRELLATFERGRLLRDGVRCAIVGRPNVGKSSLLNALLGYERSIVTDIPGTTRDTVEEKCVLGGVLLRLIDTAGLRESAEAVERLGVERTLSAMGNAGLILAVLDSSVPVTDEDLELVRKAEALAPTIVVWNKCDLPQAGAPGSASDFSPSVHVSAREGTGLSGLADCVGALFAGRPLTPGEIITNERQAEELERAVQALSASVDALKSGTTPDAVLMEVEEALSALGALTGRILRDDVVDRIFQRFCVGK